MQCNPSFSHTRPVNQLTVAISFGQLGIFNGFGCFSLWLGDPVVVGSLFVVALVSLLGVTFLAMFLLHITLCPF